MPTEDQLQKLRKIKPSSPSKPPPDYNGKLQEGTHVEHSRFGRGQVVKIEGIGQDQKAEINFAKGGIKKLLLRFAKLEVLD